jgi:hypothetical protein
MTMRDWIDQYSDENVMDDESNGLLVMDGFDDCIVGIGSRFGSAGHEQFVIYARRKVIEKLMKRDGMSEEEAVEFHEFNQVGAFVGPHTPAFLDTPEPISEE